MFTHEHFYINTSHLNHSKSSVNSGKDNSVPTQSEKLMRGKKKNTHYQEGHQMRDLCYCCKSKSKNSYVGQKTALLLLLFSNAEPFIYAG